MFAYHEAHDKANNKMDSFQLQCVPTLKLPLDWSDCLCWGVLKLRLAGRGEAVDASKGIQHIQPLIELAERQSFRCCQTESVG